MRSLLAVLLLVPALALAASSRGGLLFAFLAQPTGPVVTCPITDGLSIWLDASQIVGLSNGQAVTTWADASGNAHDFAAGGGDANPVYQTGVLNGRPIVHCGSTRCNLTGPNLALNPTTIIYVSRKLGSSASSPSDYTVAFGNEGRYGWYFNNGDGSGLLSNNSAGVSLGTMNDTSWHVYSIGVNSGVSNASYLYFDGSQVGSGFTYSVRDAASSFTAFQIAGYSLNGDIAEVYVYNRLLDSTEIGQMATCIHTKWGT